jgi:succinate dehydrogenase flavin-adding protein (antitoxin of CptAB toxin-antitoxin module)
LLALEDTDLMRYLMGDERINRPVLSSLIDVIRALPAI